MTNAERAELKMWIRRLDSAKKALRELLSASTFNSVEADKNLGDAIDYLEAIK